MGNVQLLAGKFTCDTGVTGADCNKPAGRVIPDNPDPAGADTARKIVITELILLTGEISATARLLWSVVQGGQFAYSIFQSAKDVAHLRSLMNFGKKNAEFSVSKSGNNYTFQNSSGEVLAYTRKNTANPGEIKDRVTYYGKLNPNGPQEGTNVIRLGDGRIVVVGKTTGKQYLVSGEDKAVFERMFQDLNRGASHYELNAPPPR